MKNVLVRVCALAVFASVLPTAASQSNVLFAIGNDVVLVPKKVLPCGGTAVWGEAVRCGTTFLGPTRIVIRSNSEPDAVAASNIGIEGLTPFGRTIVTLHPRFPTVYEEWFWGGNIIVYHSRVGGWGTVTVSH